MKKLLLPLLMVLPLGLLAAMLGCSDAPPADPWNGYNGLRIVASFAPIECFARNVVGDKGDLAMVRGLLTTQGPHHADPSNSQARLLSKAHVLFANGLQVDDRIARKMVGDLEKKGLKVFYLGRDIPKEMLLEGECACCKEEGHEHGPNEPGHKGYDGHVWLGIDTAKKEVELIGNALDSLNNYHKPAFQRIAKDYIVKLDKLHADGIAMLKDKKNRTILPFHGSLAYFAKSFDLKLIDPIQEIPGQEPSAKHLDDIVKQCVKEKVRVIAVEPQYNSETSAKAILEELNRRGLTDVEIITIDPLETCPEAEMNAGWYETKMRRNLEALAKALR